MGLTHRTGILQERNAEAGKAKRKNMRASCDTEFGGSSTSISTRFRQQTLKNSIYCSGTGLHGGAKVSMSLHPAAPDTGIVFRRSDIDGDDALIEARYDLVSDTRLCTTLSNDAGVSVSTVEHLMAALAGCELDNVIVEINGPELPIMDGSAEPFVFLIDCAGVVDQTIEIRPSSRGSMPSGPSVRNLCLAVRSCGCSGERWVTNAVCS